MHAISSSHSRAPRPWRPCAALVLLSACAPAPPATAPATPPAPTAAPVATAPVPANGAPAVDLLAPPAGTRAFTLLATAELFGTVEPCGCTSDPLGDLARTTALLGSLGPAVWVDGGAMLWPREVDPKKRFQLGLRAALIAEVARASGLAVSRGAAGAPALPSSDRVVRAGDVAVGVLAAGADPAAQARALRKQGAEIVVGLFGDRRQARRALGQAPDLDIGVVGERVGDGEPLVERVGDGLLVQSADQGRRVAVLRVVLRPGAPRRLEDVGGPAQRRAAIARLDRELAALAARLADWGRQQGADAAFLAARRRDLAALGAERERLQATPERRLPDRASMFEHALVDIRRKLPRDPAVAARMRDLDRQVSRQNLEAARREPPAPLPPGANPFVGGQACDKAGCHPGAVAFWRKTAHARAWKTLVEVDKQYDYDCIACHVTGYGKPGGATLARHEPLVDVQCETCHGPGGQHVAGEGLEDPPAIVRAPDERLCASECHTPEHSDTFDRAAYLRDITGPGHAPKLRAALGDGPTGRSLRGAAKAKAAH